MRENIGLFRGKWTDNGEWIEGAFCPKSSERLLGLSNRKPHIIKLDDPFDGFWFEVDPDTVGECTGLRDKNGELIFEGDILSLDDGHIVDSGCVHYDEGGWCVNNNFMQAWMWNSKLYGVIIGNIHDNPELLKGGAVE